MRWIVGISPKSGVQPPRRASHNVGIGSPHVHRRCPHQRDLRTNAENYPQLPPGYPPSTPGDIHPEHAYVHMVIPGPQRLSTDCMRVIHISSCRRGPLRLVDPDAENVPHPLMSAARGRSATGRRRRREPTRFVERTNPQRIARVLQRHHCLPIPNGATRTQ